MKRIDFICLILCLTSALVFAQSNGIPPVKKPLVPTAVNPGRTPFQLTLNGTDFVSGATVNSNRNPSASRFVNEGQLNSAGSAEQVLYTFTGGSDGGLAVAGLIFDESGNLYGTTAGGGSQACGGNGCGTIFELSPNPEGGWKETVLYSFTGGSDGWDPQSALVSDSKGNFYGVAEVGGSSACTYVLGCGTVFELSPNGNGGWTEATLYSFVGGSDGQNPNASLIFDKQGNLYGTTFFGGVPSCYADVGCGTVFELTPKADIWTETVLYRFTGGNDGAFLRSGLILDAGNLYGTTEQGGGNGCYSRGCGTVFELKHSKAGWEESVLYSFSGGSDGAFPEADLILNAGNLYSTTEEGGDSSCTVDGGLGGCGTVFEMHPSTGTWEQSVLYSFTGGEDGIFPQGGLTLYKSSLYGLTQEGGGGGCYESYGCGTVFKLGHSKTGWAESVLYRFDGSDGEYPFWGSLIFDQSGNLYGTTNNGGSYGEGNVFEVNPSAAVTTTRLTASPNPSTFDQAVTFIATVTPAPSDGETITFEDGNTVLGTGSLSAGSASFTTSTLAAGNNSITAGYGGDFDFLGSKSNALKEFVEIQGVYGVVSPTAVNFGQVVVDQTSAQKLVSLTNTGNSQLTVSSISISGDFAIPINRCAEGVKPATHCNVYLTFTPHVLGTQTGTLTFMDNATNTPQTISLTGTGIN